MLGEIFETLLSQLYDAEKFFDSIEDATLELNTQEKIIEKCVGVMSNDQKLFYDRVLEGIENVSSNITIRNKGFFNCAPLIFRCEGIPGTGKSFLQNTINAYCRHNKIGVTVVAPTNYIATQQKGITINQAVKTLCFDVLGVNTFKLDVNVAEKIYSEDKNFKNNKLRLASLPDLVSRITNSIGVDEINTFYDKWFSSNRVNVILIDEGSMITSLSFATLLCSYPPSNTIYILFYGPNQLPPVSPELNLNCCYDVDWNEYAFDGQVHRLVTQQRFSDITENLFHEFVKEFSLTFNDDDKNKVVDVDKIALLSKVKYFAENIKIGGSLLDYKNCPSKDKVLIVATNKKRQQENLFRLRTEGEGRIYEIPAILEDGLPRNYDVYSNLGIDQTLEIKRGSVCFCRANILEKGLVKGMLLTVCHVNVNEKGNVDYIRVCRRRDQKLKDDEKEEKKDEIVLSRHSFETRVTKKSASHGIKTYFNVEQFPITLGYAITAHSVQGKTLQCKVGIDLETSFSWDLLLNMFFVAITRVRRAGQIFMDNHPAIWLLKTFDPKTTTIERVNEMYEKYIALRENNRDFKIDDKMSEINELWTNNYRNRKKEFTSRLSEFNNDDDTLTKLVSMYPENSK